MANHEQFMQRAIDLARLGIGKVAPNPMVGCVIVKNDNIISEGYHQQYGMDHAEVNAINNLPADFNFENCTLYVNLEPCSHFGKTPPCSNLIIQKKIKKVIVANLDCNPIVSGKGIQRLRENNCEVITGVLDKQARELNKRFFCFHEKKRPYIILKWAETTDGFISKNPVPINRNENWITCEKSKKLVHKWRSEEQAILVGKNTVMQDDPQLTTRLVSGKNPARIILDSKLSIPSTAKVYEKNADVVVFNNLKNETLNNIHFIKLNLNVNPLISLFHKLLELNYLSVIVEGGTFLLNSLIEQNLWDEARIFVANKNFQNGIVAPKINKSNASVETIGTDLLFILKND
jgi:diaminohydroxyphosphoribosylaminopyrimidine deaminase/5-amino-6-(5-phosphoribosylamino)uracil reductase